MKKPRARRGRAVTLAWLLGQPRHLFVFGFHGATWTRENSASGRVEVKVGVDGALGLLGMAFGVLCAAHHLQRVGSVASPAGCRLLEPIFTRYSSPYIALFFEAVPWPAGRFPPLRKHKASTKTVPVDLPTGVTRLFGHACGGDKQRTL
eukprot:scaffold2575_cov35-Phaeocystis_antarctica.AAC.1